MALWGVNLHRGEESISIHVLPHIVFGGMIVFLVTQSIAILLQYGRTESRA